jgi:predicted dehydrogenase
MSSLKRLKPIPTVIIGANAWIAEKAHSPAMLATGLYDLVGAIPGTSENSSTKFLRRWPGIPSKYVSHDPGKVYPDLAKRYGSRLLVVNTTATPSHLGVLTHAIHCGVQNLVSDKALVESPAEYAELYDELLKLQGRGVQGVTFNHAMAPGVFQLRQLLAGLGANLSGVELSGSFWQYWVEVQTDHNWRFEMLGGVKDLGCHVSHGVTTIVGSPVVSVSNGKLAKTGSHRWDIYDTGSAVLTHANGLKTKVDYTQVRPGNADNIFYLLKLPNGQHYLWRLELGADALWKSKKGVKKPDPNKISDWELHLRGFSDEFTSPDAKKIDLAPPGHVLGWPDLMRLWYFAFAGEYYRVNDGAQPDELLGVMTLPFARMESDGRETVDHVDAWRRSFENDGTEIKISA